MIEPNKAKTAGHGFLNMRMLTLRVSCYAVSNFPLTFLVSNRFRFDVIGFTTASNFKQMCILFICNAPYINLYRVSDVNKKKVMLSNFRNFVSTLNKTGNSENFYVEKYLTAVLNCITN